MYRAFCNTHNMKPVHTEGSLGDRQHHFPPFCGYFQDPTPFWDSQILLKFQEKLKALKQYCQVPAIPRSILYSSGAMTPVGNKDTCTWDMTANPE